MKRVYCSLLLAVVCLVSGCAYTYVQDYYFIPHPATEEVASTQPSEPPPVSTYATIIGIRNADKKLGSPASIEIRLRLDNNSSQPVTFNIHSLRLTTGTLARFPAPTIESGPVKILPDDTALITAEFPFPGGQSYKHFDLHTLILHWTLRIGPRPVTQSAQFHRQFPRVYYGYGDPYWDDYPYGYYPGPYFGGVVIVHQHWHR